MSPVVFVHFHLLKAILLNSRDTKGICEYAKSSNLAVSAAAVSALASLVAQAVSDSKVSSFDPSLLEVMKSVIASLHAFNTLTTKLFLGAEE